MFRQEKEEVREFVEKQLRKGYIRPSKSPQTSPVFFVGKKRQKEKDSIELLIPQQKDN